MGPLDSRCPFLAVPSPARGLPVVSGNLLFHLGDEVAFGTRVFLALLGSRLAVRRALQVVGLLFDVRGLGLVRALVMEEQHVHVGGGERALVALVLDSRAAGRPRGQVQKQERTVGAITFSTGERVSNFSKVLFWAAEASGTEWTVLNGTLMNVMELLIMTEEGPHDDDIGAMALGISKVAELTIVACYHVIFRSLAGEVLLFSLTWSSTR